MRELKELDWFIDKIGQAVIRWSEGVKPVQVRIYSLEHAKWLCDTQYDGDNYKTHITHSLLRWG